ncbi:Ig-like domain-containing protein [Bacillus cereus]|uniref:Ig-like domain-containing protein n=1 Tax=Bacillus cereus TaxID=1396 RepID=UPI001EDF3AE6|nr:Ig-like domain-containing protein [Bacillus cereus]
MKKKNRRIDQLKPINLVATAAIVATTLFTPVMDILPGQSSMAYAANQENLPNGSIMANAANQWSGLTLPAFNNATKQGFTKGTEYATVLNRGAITWGTSQQGAFPGVLEMKSRPRENHISTKFVILYKQAVTYDAATKSWGFVEGDGVFTDDTSKPTKPVGVVTVRKNIGPELDKWGVVQIVALPNRDGLRVYYNEELVFEVKYPLNGKVFPTSSIRINGKNTTLPAVPAMDIAGVNMVRDMSEWLSVSLKVNDVTDQDTKVSGTGKPGANISIVVDGKEIGTGKVDDQGNYTVDIPKQPGGKEIAATLTDAGNTSQPVKTIVQSKAVVPPTAPKVNIVTDQDTKVTGTGEKGATVKVVVDGKEIGTGKVDDQGNYSVDIPKQAGGKEVVVTLTDAAGNTSQPGKTKVEEKDVTAPEAPKVNKVTDQDTKVAGTGEKGATVKVTVDGKEIGTGKVNDQGNYSVDIPKQSGGKEVVVTLTDAAGNTSQPGKTKVEEKDVTAPEAPKVNKVTDQDTKVAGTGEKGATVKVTVDGKEIGTGKVDDQGNYSVNIPKQLGGKEVVVTLTDAAGNISKPTKTTVQEDPAIEDAKVKVAKQAIDDILTDLIQTNYSHDFSIVKKGAIQVHVAQQHINEAQEKVKAISDKRAEKAQLQKEIEKAQKLWDERSKDTRENLVQNGFFDSGLDDWNTWLGAGSAKPIVEEDGGKSRNVLKVNSNSSVEQILTNLQPNTTYELSLYAKSPTGEGMSVGVKNTGITNVSVPVKSKDYSLTKIRFMTGADPTKTTLYLYKSSGAGSGLADVVAVKEIVDESVLKAPQVNEVAGTDTKVTGTGKPEATIFITVNGKEIGKGTADEKGNYTVTIPKQTEGTSIQVVQKVNGSTSPTTTVQVKDVTAPTAPKVSPITDDDAKVKGTGEPNTSVSVQVNGKEIGKEIGKGMVDEKGNYSVDIPKQVTGTQVSVTLTDKAGNTSPETKVQVQVNQKKLIEDAKSAVNQLLTDMIKSKKDNKAEVVPFGAIQIDVTQSKIDEAKLKVQKIADERKEKAELQKEMDRVQQLFNGRSNEQVGNIVQNGLFDFGLEYWKTWTGTSATAPSVQGEDNKSRNIVKVKPNSSIEQTVTGLEPNTTYEFTLYAKTENDEKFSIGVKNAGAPNVSVPVYSKEYSQSKIRFTTGDNATTATLYLYKSAGKGSGYADIAIMKKVIDEESITQAVNHLFTDRIYNSGKKEEVQKKQAIQPGIKESDLQRIGTNIESITDAKLKEQLQKEVKRAQELYETKQKQQASNLVKNGAFEEGLNSWKPWKASETKVGPTVVEKEGGLINVFKLETGTSSVEQTLQVEPNTTYELASYGKTANDEKLSMGVKKMVGVVDASVANFSNEYAEQVVRFTTGTDTTTVTIYAYKGKGTSPSYMDDIRLYKVN